MLLKHKKLFFSISIIILRILLDYLYIIAISPLYSYAGLTYEPTTRSFLFSWAILLIGILLVYPFLRKKEFVISNAALLLFILFFVPWTSLIYSKPQPYNYIIIESIYWYLIFLLLNINISNKYFNFTPQKQYNESFLLLIAFLLIISVIYVSGTYANFRIKLDFIDIYDLRFEARDFDLPIILSYLLPAAANILPILLLFFISKRNWLMVWIISIIIILNFSINGSKSTVFKLVLCFLLYNYAKRDVRMSIPFFLSLLIIFGVVEFYYFDSDFIANIILRRTFYVPSLLDSYYYDLIDQYGPAFFSHKINGNEIAFYIGDVFFDNEEMRANNGLFSDAYMNLSLYGCIVFPVIYTLFFNICEIIFKGVRNQIKFYAVFIIVLTMRSSEFTTALLTHGLFLLCLTLAIMPRDKVIENEI